MQLLKLGIMTVLIKQNITNKEHRSTPDVALPDQDTSMVNGLGHASLEDKGLETPCKEVHSSKSKDVINVKSKVFFIIIL